MKMAVPQNLKIYHIVHIDRLSSIIGDGFLWCDSEVHRRETTGTTIGMSSIKHRRLYELTLSKYTDLHIGDCVPFYFCPRSVMLYLIYQANNPELTYHGGQEPIIHLEADLHKTIEWAQTNNHRWAFTLSNAGSNYFEDRFEIKNLDEINWNAVFAKKWSGNGVPQSVKEGKQAEFLLEKAFPWQLIERIGVCSTRIYKQAINMVNNAFYQPQVFLVKDWYY